MKKSNQLEVSIGKDAYEVGLIWLDQRRASECQPPTNREHTGVWPIRKDDELWSEGILLELGFPMFSVSWHDLDSLNCLRTQHRITGAQVRLNDKKNIFFLFFLKSFNLSWYCKSAVAMYYKTSFTSKMFWHFQDDLARLDTKNDRLSTCVFLE